MIRGYAVISKYLFNKMNDLNKNVVRSDIKIL